jgi:hypothetical protein
MRDEKFVLAAQAIDASVNTDTATTKSHRIVSKRVRNPVSGIDDFCDQIRGLNPAHLILSDIQRLLDGSQRCCHDLHVQNRHEHADAHHGETSPHRRGYGFGGMMFGRGNHSRFCADVRRERKEGRKGR